MYYTRQCTGVSTKTGAQHVDECVAPLLRRQRRWANCAT
jgi:hypothetical protein